MKKTFGVLFLIFITIFGVLLAVLPKDSYSEIENRAMSKLPQIGTAEDFAAFPEAFDSYVTDSFPLRVKFIRLRNAVSLVSLKNEFDGAFICTDGSACEAFESADESLKMRQVSALNIFTAASGADVYFAIVPTKASFSDALPPFAVNADQSDYIKSLYSSVDAHCIDIFSTLLLHADEYIYYNTDHHWTTLGAYYAYNTIASEMGLNTVEKDDFYVSTVSDTFLGTLYSKCLFDLDFDTIFRYDYTNDISTSVIRDGTVFNGMYFDEYLGKKDKYSYFLGGNSGLIHITGSSASGKSLVIVRDSFASCLAPFFIADYTDIWLVDMRYASVDSVSEIRADDVLIIYNAKTFSEDTGIIRLSRAVIGKKD